MTQKNDGSDRVKWSVMSTSLALKNGVKDIQTAGYNGACTVPIANGIGIRVKSSLRA